MHTRTFGRVNRTVSEIGFGAWAIGGSWGDVSEADARGALHAALDAGTTFIDTADVYGDGRSERIIAEVLKERGGERPFVATKAGRRLSPHVADGYTEENLRDFVDRSLINLQTDCSISCSCIARQPKSSIAQKCSKRWIALSRPAKSATMASQWKRSRKR